MPERREQHTIEAGPCLIFLHIPKAAGSTLQSVFARLYGDRIYTIQSPGLRSSWDEFQSLPEQQRRRYRVVRGHMPFGLHTALPQGAVYLTVLRSVVERVVSAYHFILRRPTHYLYDRVASPKMSLSDFVSEQVTTEIDNLSVRFLCGDWDACVHVREDGSIAEPEVRFGQCTREMLNRAKDHLESHFAVVGLTDRFAETFVLCRETFGWPAWSYVRRNTAQGRDGRSEIDPRVLSQIRNCNELDLELEEHGRRLFEQQLRRRNRFTFWCRVQLHRAAQYRTDRRIGVSSS